MIFEEKYNERSFDLLNENTKITESSDNSNSSLKTMLDQIKSHNLYIRSPDDLNSIDSIDKNHFYSISEAKKIATYCLKMHKEIIDTYNEVYTQSINNLYDKSFANYDVIKDFNHIFDNYNNMPEKLLEMSEQNSSDLVYHILTKNMFTFIKSIEIVRQFYRDVYRTYVNYLIDK